jgi:hypothetical protein
MRRSARLESVNAQVAIMTMICALVVIWFMPAWAHAQQLCPRTDIAYVEIKNNRPAYSVQSSFTPLLGRIYLSHSGISFGTANGMILGLGTQLKGALGSYTYCGDGTLGGADGHNKLNQTDRTTTQSYCRIRWLTTLS